ncbi:MAG: DUF1761 domain-containing protein [Devosia sp.]
MHIELNYFAVLGAALAGVIINALWYSVILKGPVDKLRVADPTIAGRQPAPPMYAVAILGQVVMAFVLASVLKFTGADSIFEGVHVAALLWLGFTATAVSQVHTFGYRQGGFILVDTLNWLLAAIVMGIILGLWG